MAEQAQANPGTLMSIGTVAAHNIAAILNLSQEHVGTIEQAIKDEINAMSSHFTLAFADIQTQHEVAQINLKKDYDAAVAEIKSTYKFVRANIWKLLAVFIGVFLVGVGTGLVV